MKNVFIDAGPFYALNNPRDQYFLQAQVLIQKLKTNNIRLITTDYIIEETATSLLTSFKGGYWNAVNFLNWILGKTQPVVLEWIDQKRFFQASMIFLRYNKDKQWSFTDCTSFVIIKELKIPKVFTFDEHFKQMGFTILK